MIAGRVPRYARNRPVPPMWGPAPSYFTLIAFVTRITVIAVQAFRYAQDCPALPQGFRHHQATFATEGCFFMSSHRLAKG